MGLSTTLKIAFDAKRVQRGLAGIKSGFAGIVKAGAGIAKVGVAFLAITAAASAAVLKINAIGEEGRASDQRLQNIVKTMGLFGGASDDVAERLLDLADAQSRLTGIDDDVIALTQSKLLTFKELALTANIVGGAFDRATQAALDMAAAGFGTAETNAVQLGKALNDPIKGINSLTRSGITFTTKEKELIASLVAAGRAGEAQNIVLKAIETQVKGTAAATATSSGKIKASMSQLTESFAKPLSTGFDTLPGKMESVFAELTAKATMWGSTFADAIYDSVNGNQDKLMAIGKLIGDVITSAATAAFQASSGSLLESYFGMMEEAGVPGYSQAGKFLKKKVAQNSPSFGELFDAHMTIKGVGKQYSDVTRDNDPAQATRPTRPPEADGGAVLQKQMLKYAAETAKNTREGAKM
jgi:hypothetical protein